MQRLRFEKFEYYFGQRREVFYAMADNVGIRRLHGQFALNLEPEQVKKYGAKQTIKELVNAYEYSVISGEVNKKRVEAAAAKYDSESRAKGPVLFDHIVEKAGQ